MVLLECQFGMSHRVTWGGGGLWGNAVLRPACGGRQRSLVKGEADVGGGDVALVSVGAAHAGPAIALVLLHHGQHLTLLHGNGAFTGACRGEGTNKQTQ